MSVWSWIAAWGGLNRHLPTIDEVKDPVHGEKARNSRGQKVLYDANQGFWVMPQNFSSKKPVKID